ncbi:ABC transporter permease [Nitratireductor sp. GISD-1A_MAKvit]|uniref:ABC transporter permease n=1 Tax=Nitratireductor sp. GISD-1A_MAKvit TaxID=3234198 RepID=UPI0034658D0A
MWSYALKRVLTAIPTVFLVLIIVFTLIRLIPGDPAELMLYELDDPAVVQQMREDLGLEQPIPVQFFIWLGNLATGDLGVSIRTHEPVLPALLERFSVTATLVFWAVSFAVLIAVPAGMVAAWKQNTKIDFAIVLMAIFKLSLPSFWVGLMLLLFFGVYLQWLPTVGYVELSTDFGVGVLYLIMPVISLALTEIAVLTRMMRSGTLEVLRLEYVTHARAKGLSEGAVLARHVFKNAFAPALTMLGLVMASLLGGAAVTETVFSLPGIGKLVVDSIYARDYPMLQGALLLIAGVYVVVNLVVDLLYGFFDPRVTLK